MAERASASEETIDSWDAMPPNADGRGSQLIRVRAVGSCLLGRLIIVTYSQTEG